MVFMKPRVGRNADLDMWTMTEIARPRCNIFANCYLIFAVEEAPAVNISAMSFWFCSVAIEPATSFGG